MYKQNLMFCQVSVFKYLFW